MNKDFNKNDKDNFYYNIGAIGPGRGFGNLDVSNNIHFGNASRDGIKENNQLLDHKFQFLDRDYQNPKHIVMSIPRGGCSTRDKIQLVNNTVGEKIIFNY